MGKTRSTPLSRAEERYLIMKQASTFTRSILSPRRATLTALALGAATVLGATALPLASVASSSPTTIVVTQNKTWGPTLTLKDGATIYRLTKDPKNKSVCNGKCATIWTPVLLATGQSRPAGVGVSHLGSFTRSNGTKQVTYEGIPLYLFTGDKKIGDVTGNIKDTWGQWWSINPKSPLTPPKKKSGGTTTTSPIGY
jgi:predicted lipoprotein with Yx(FWY)xxD motif